MRLRGQWTPKIEAMHAPEFRFGLRWILGIPFRNSPYICPDCGREADPLGIHATTCQRSGAITRGHNTLRDCLARLFSEAGISVEMEQSPADMPDRRPADILLLNWKGKRLAIDCTLITPVRLSAMVNVLLPDEATRLKIRKNTAPCASAGWTCKPFVADVFGALHADARKLLAELIARHASDFQPLTRGAAGRTIYSTITGAAVARAAIQIARHARMDAPAGIPTNSLELFTPRLPRSTLPRASESPAGAVTQVVDPVDISSGNGAPPAVVRTCTPSAALPASAYTVHLIDHGGHQFPVVLDQGAFTDVLFDAVGIPRPNFWLSHQGHALLAGVPAQQYALCNGSVVLVHLRVRGGASPSTPAQSLSWRCAAATPAHLHLSTQTRPRPAAVPFGSVAWHGALLGPHRVRDKILAWRWRLRDKILMWRWRVRDKILAWRWRLRDKVPTWWGSRAPLGPTGRGTRSSRGGGGCGTRSSRGGGGCGTRSSRGGGAGPRWALTGRG